MILSICIATFNRSSQLNHTLGVIASQIAACDSVEIELIVGDNCSTDETESICMDFSEKFSFIRFYRHKKNIGAEGNYFFLAGQARGDYIWFLSDDDFLMSNAVGAVFSALRGNRSLGFVFVNYQFYDILEKKVSPSSCIAVDDELVSDAERFYQLTQFANSFIAATVYNRKKWLQISSQFYAQNDYWPQLYIVDNLLNSGCSALVLSAPLLSMGCDHIMVSRNEKKKQGDDHFYFDAHMMFARFLGTMSENNSKKMGYKKFYVGNFYQVILYKVVVDKYDIEYIFRAFLFLSSIPILRSSFRYWAVDLPILLLPAFFSKAIYNIYEHLPIVANWSVSTNKLERSLFHIYALLRYIKRSFNK